MATRITTDMLNALGGALTAENVRCVRALLAAAGVVNVELHPLELGALRSERERERAARSAAERILSLGPMPPHTCELGDDGRVELHHECVHGCRPFESRRESV